MTFPAEFIDQPRWAIWRKKYPLDPAARKDPDNAKYGKIPHSPIDGGRVSKDDPSRLGTFIQAQEALNLFYGSGLAYSIPGRGFVVFDYDHIIIDGVIPDLILWELRQLCSYTERSQSGTGIHVIVRIDPAAWQEVAPLVEYSGEVFGGEKSHFLYITGDVIDGYPCEIRENTAGFLAVSARRRELNQTWNPPHERPVRQVEYDGDNELLISEFFQIELADFISGDMREIKPGVWQGSHPQHGSTTGTNFLINLNHPEHWHCFRHTPETDGGALKLWCMVEGLFPCELFTPGYTFTKREWYRIFQQLRRRKPRLYREWERYTNTGRLPERMSHARR